MSDYTDIGLHIENAIEELKKAEKLIDDHLDFAYDTDIVLAQLYNGDFKRLMNTIDRVELRTNQFMDLIEKGINK